MNNKWILYGLILLILIYIFIPGIFPSKKQEPDVELINRIDKLELENIELKKDIEFYDTVVYLFDEKIAQLDSMVKGVKEKPIIVREIYKDKTNQVQNFVPNKVDSFFKDRYNF